MIGNDIIQADIVAALLAEVTITALLANVGEVREANYMAPDWSYPTIRVAIDNQTPRDQSEQCDHAILNFRILVFSDKPSSLESQQIATAVNKFFHRKYLRGTGYNINKIRSSGFNGPSPAGEFRWMNQCLFKGNVYPTTAS